jgi:hypothetical protein
MARPVAFASVVCACLLSSAAVAQPFGKTGGEFRVNTYTTGYQGYAALGMDTAGGFLVVWKNGFFPNDLRAQRYAASGAALGGELPLTASSTTVFTQYPAVVGQSSGRYVVVWANAAATGDGMNIRIFAQRIQDGSLTGAAFRVDTGVTTARDRVPAVAPTASGDFAVVWGRELLLGATDDFDLYGRRFTSDGVALGGEFHISMQTTNQGSVPPAIARRSDGAFLVAWTAHFPPAAIGTVFVQAYDASGTTSAYLVSDAATAADEQIPGAAYDAAGNFVVVWAGNYHTAGGYLWGQRYDTAANPLGGTFRVDTSTNALPKSPQVVSDSSGNFVVVWGSDKYAIYGRRYASSGAALSEPFRVNTMTSAYLKHANVAMNAKGDFVVVWRFGTYASHADIHAQHYCAALAGDADGTGTLDVSDVFYLINALFAGGPAPLKSADANGDGKVDVADVFYLINYLFAAGSGPACA